MASGINIYSELLIIRIPILDISNSEYMLITLSIKVVNCYDSTSSSKTSEEEAEKPRKPALYSPTAATGITKPLICGACGN